jgi:hypothetical protein
VALIESNRQGVKDAKNNRDAHCREADEVLASRGYRSLEFA